jgi:hypothetical protein
MWAVKLWEEYSREVPIADGTKRAVRNFAERDVNRFSLHDHLQMSKHRERRVKLSSAHIW